MKEDSIRVICNKNPEIEYKERRCAYAIIQDDNENIAIANVDEYFFLFGGGIEDNETELETLKREMIEETGYTIKDIKLYEKLISYEYSESKGNLKIVATIYTARFDRKVSEAIEKDHFIVWGKPEEYRNKVYHEYQRVILKEYGERIKNKLM